MQIKTIHLPSLRNEEYHTFMSQTIVTAENFGVSEHFAPLWAVFKSRFETLLHTLEVVRKSALTAHIRGTDRMRAALHRNLILRIRCSLHDPDAARHAAAVSLRNLLAHYGSLTGVSRAQRTGTIDNLLSDLHRADVAPEVALLDLTGLVGMLGDAQARYKSLSMQRNEEKVARPTISVRKARGAMNEVYREFMQSVDTRNGLVAPGSLNSGVRALNRVIKHFHALIAQRAAARRARKAQGEEPEEVENAVPAANV